MGRLVFVVQHLDELLVLDVLLDVVETDEIPAGSRSLLILSALSLLILQPWSAGSLFMSQQGSSFGLTSILDFSLPAAS